MPDTDLQALSTEVLWAMFALSAGLGVIAQRPHFCTTGAVADVVNIGDWISEDLNTFREAFVATHSQRMEALSFVTPCAYALDWLMLCSDKSKRLTAGIVSVVGVVLMGVGGVTALGCTIGQGLSGVSTLMLTSFVAALHWLRWRIEREG